MDRKFKLTYLKNCMQQETFVESKNKYESPYKYKHKSIQIKLYLNTSQYN